MNESKKEIANSYIKNIVSSIGKKVNNFVFVKHYGKYEITSEDARDVMAMYDNVEVCYTHFENNEMVGSFEPFLTIIKNCYIKYYSNITVDEYLAKFDIYQLHKFFFKTYIDKGTCERDEPYIIDEIEYEKRKIVESVASIVIDLSEKHPMLIIIDNAHKLSKTTISLLGLIFDNPENKNIGIFAAYNDLKKVSAVNREAWNQFINTIVVKKFMFEIGAFESKNRVEDSSKFVFDSKRAYEYLMKLRTMYCAVDLEHAHYYLQKIYDKLSNEQMDINFNCKFELLKLYAQVLIYLGDFATALLVCDNLKEMCDIDKSPEYECEYHILHIYTQMYNGKVEYARKSAEQFKRIAFELGDEKYIFKADMMRIMVETSGWHNIYFLRDDVIVTDDFIKRVQKNNYYNHLAYIYIYAYDNNFEKVKQVKTQEEFELKLIKFREGIQIAKQLGNMYLIRKAYRKVIMMTSSIGLFGITEHYYDKYIECLEPDEEMELSDVKNGLGYIYCTSRKFKKANECYNTSLDIFIRHNDIKMVGETLYNMSMNCILAEDYSNAYNYLKVCTAIIEKMRLNDLRVCNIAKIYGLLALCSVRLSYEYDSLFYLNTCRKFLGHLINDCDYVDIDGSERALTGNDDELFLYYFVSGLIEEKKKSYEKALKYYKKAEKHCLCSVGNMFFSFVQLKVSMANVYKKLEKDEKFLQMVNEACDYANTKNYVEQMDSLMSMRQTGEYTQMAKELPLNNHTLSEIEGLLEKSSIAMQNKDMRNQMDFISIWQNVIEINNRTKEELINTAANSFFCKAYY